MNKNNLIMFILFVLLFSCKSDNNKYPQLALEDTLQKSTFIKKVKIDIENSKIYWKGTKMRGLGKHEGEIKFSEGYFSIEENKIVGGEFIVDMNTIYVTDIPVHETIPRRNLNNHLKSDDFFAVSKYPLARFKIETINSNDISGILTIRDISKTIDIKAEVVQLDNTFKLTTTFNINRFDWNVGYTGSWVDKTLVDKDIQFIIEITN